MSITLRKGSEESESDWEARGACTGLSLPSILLCSPVFDEDRLRSPNGVLIPCVLCLCGDGAMS